MQPFVIDRTAGSANLGYGCSQLMGGITRRESIALLETAFEAGIRHFDTAPLYGYGEAESVLGEALRGKRHHVTIATKYGLRPPSGSWARAVAGALRPVVRCFPGLKAGLSRAAGNRISRARFSSAELRLSVEASLKALKTDYIDILLLHEARASDLSDELFEALERGLAAGTFRAFGIGSEALVAAEIHRLEPRFCSVMQFEWSVLNREKPAYPGSFLITHRSLSDSFASLRTWLSANSEVARKWSNELGQEIADASVLAHLMLAAACHANAKGITLFSSRKAQNIKANAALLQDRRALVAGAAFAALIRHDAPENLMRTSARTQPQPAALR